MTAESPPPQHDAEWNEPFLMSFVEGLKRNWATYTMFVVLVMALASIIVAVSGINAANENNARLQKLVECQNSYNEINNERSRQLADSVDKENFAEVKADVALLKLVTVMVKEQQSVGKQEDVDHALEALRERLDEQSIARAETAKDRAEHPVPPPPRALCGAP